MFKYPLEVLEEMIKLHFGYIFIHLVCVHPVEGSKHVLLCLDSPIMVELICETQLAIHLIRHFESEHAGDILCK